MRVMSFFIVNRLIMSFDSIRSIMFPIEIGWQVMRTFFLIIALTFSGVQTLPVYADTHKSDKFDKEIKKYAWYMPICFIWSKRNHRPVCVTVDGLNRVFPKEAIAISNEVRQAVKMSLKATPNTIRSNLDIRTRIRTIDVFMGCSVAGGNIGGVRLGEAAASSNSRLRKALRRGYWRLSRTYTDRRAAACSANTKVTAAQPRAVRVAARFSGIVTVVEALGIEIDKNYREAFADCIRGKQRGRPIPAAGVLGKALGWIEKKLGTDKNKDPNPGNDNYAPGSRGYCMPEVMDCNGVNSCYAVARGVAGTLIKAHQNPRLKYDGCGINVTPDPNNPDPCRKDEPILEWLRLAGTPAVAKRDCKQDWMALRQPGSVSLCAGQLPANTGKQFPGGDPCADPRVMCSDHEVIAPIARDRGPLPPIPNPYRARPSTR